MLEISRRASGEVAPASFAQELFFLVDRSSPGVTAYNVPRMLRLRGALDVPALRAALDGLVARHEVLRTTYEQHDGATMQRVHAPRAVEFEQVDLGTVPEAERERALSALLLERAQKRIDLSHDQLLAATLVRMRDDDHVLVARSHHIASDGWSKSIFFRELGALYAAHRAGARAELPELPIQVADYAAWERSDARQGELEEHLAYWREQLRGPLPTLELPTDRPRTASPGTAGSHRAIVLPPDLVAGIRRLAREQGATLYMVLLAAYQTLLHRYSGQPDVVVGSPVAGRGRPEVEGLIGYFANTLPMRTRFEGEQTFAELLDRVVETCLDAFEHEDVPLEQLALQLQQDGRSATTPMFQAVLTMEDTVPAPIALDGLSVEQLQIEFDATKFDLTMMVSERADGLRVALWYRTELFDAATVDRMLAHFRTLLEAVVENPERDVDALPMLSDAEQAQLAAWSPTPVAPAIDSVVAPIAVHAARDASRVAVVSGTEQLTYAGLVARARALASTLHARGVGPGEMVGLLVDRSVDAIVGILGIWYAGGAYVPLTPDLPAARLARIIELAGVKTVVAQRALHDGRLPASVNAVAFEDAHDEGSAFHVVTPHSEVPAYVLFTSGSTGEPKGVVVTHGNLASYTAAIVARLDVPDDATWSWATVSTLGADLGHTALFPALVTGGTLHVVPAAVSTDGTAWAEYSAANSIDVLKITPSHLRALLGAEGGRVDPSRLPKRWLVLGGEACPWTLAEQVLAAKACRVLNHYGPTETTVGACALEVTDGVVRQLRARTSTVPIGLPLPHATAEVLDANGRRVAVNVVGELHLGGLGVAAGYLGRADLTAERFESDPYASTPAARRYRTGDRARRVPSGEIEFLGRIDGQVKVRGYRVELGEIERVVGELPGVAACAVALRAGEDGEPRLVAYVVERTGGYAAAHAEAVTGAGVTAWVAERLPEYMVPSAVVTLDALPLTANGKLDRNALPDPEAAAPVDTYVAPRTATETSLAQIWTDVLKKDRVGVTDSFMALGGHSLLAIRALGRISKTFGIRLPLRTLFDTPTIEQIAARIDAELSPPSEADELEKLLAAVEAMPDASVPGLPTSGERPAGEPTA